MDNLNATDGKLPIIDISIYDIIERSKIPINDELSYTPYPIISKSIWSALGDKLSNNENATTNNKNILPEECFTIRLDGKNFKRLLPILKNIGILSGSYSTEFEEIMKKISHYISTKFQGVLYVFTQSDEITILINNAINNVHDYNGRIRKLISISAGLVSSKFMYLIMELAISKGIDIKLLSSLDIAFDSRIGKYNTLMEAFELILWRSYDCGINGISDAIYKMDTLNKKTMTYHSTQKLYILQENNLLPLPNHQAYGTLIIREKYIKSAKINKKTGLMEYVMKCLNNDEMVGPIVTNFKNKPWEM